MDLPIRRIITGHTPEGTAVFTSDEEFETVIIPTGDAAMSTLWTTPTVPADCNDETDGAKRDAGATYQELLPHFTERTALIMEL